MGRVSLSGPHGSLGRAQRPFEGQPPCGHKCRASTTVARKSTKGTHSCDSGPLTNSAAQTPKGGRHRNCLSTYGETDGSHTDAAVSPARPAQPGCVDVGMDTRGDAPGCDCRGQPGRQNWPALFWAPGDRGLSCTIQPRPGGQCDCRTLPVCPLNPGGPWTPARPVIPGKPTSPSAPFWPKNPFRPVTTDVLLGTIKPQLACSWGSRYVEFRRAGKGSWGSGVQVKAHGVRGEGKG